MGSGSMVGGGMEGGYEDWDGCCEVKNVWDSPKPAMNGVYKLVSKSWDIPSECTSPCVYMKMDMGGMGGMGGGPGGMGGSGGMGGGNDARFCFKPSQYTKAECDAPPDGYGSGGMGGSGSGPIGSGSGPMGSGGMGGSGS